ncbi:uncharacterized protein LOC133856711 [Alnus glutinosa]|uniref:uncharacterized protein LOC133856711 n=1 Tax=Alnus glutinosa TaxID=3517 RepID=UPI002D7A280E|nr:uncharacterized protein LOC133856711 [Alnus glutinosa]
MQSFEDVEVVDNDSEMGRSDILLSPPISDDDSGGISSNLGSEFHAMDLVNPSLKLKMKFSSLQLFREVVKQYNAQRGKDIQFVKNERARCVAVCRDPSCDYRVYCRQMSDEQSFEVRSLRPKQYCTRVYKSSIVNSRWISDKLFDKFKIQPDMPLEVIQDEVKRKWNVEVTRSQIYRGRRRAGKQIFGNLGEQYDRLWDYCETLRQTNKGSCAMMKVERPTPDSEPMLQRLYMSLPAMKQGFLEGCRPVIGLDGCFLKGPYKGTLLAAVGRNANNNMYPIAIAVVEAEIKESWTWFMECLVSDLGSHARHVRPASISNRQKGLIPSFDAVIPTADHRICVRHLYANFRDKGFRGVALKELLWAAASSYTDIEFRHHMEEIKKLNLAAFEYLDKIDPSGWSRSWFSDYPKCDLLVNMSECFNSYILKARDKLILTMLEMIRKQLQRRYQVKRDGIKTLKGKLCPRIVNKLEAIGEEATNCLSHYAGDDLFEVE